MELKRIPVRVDIVKPHQGEMMQVVSGDNEGNLLEIELTMNGSPYNIGNNIVQIVFKKPDGTKVTQSTEDIELPITTNSNKIYCILKSGTISAKGKVQAEIQITDGAKLITSAQFYFFVRLPLIDDETVQSSNELSLLVAAVQAEAERKTAELQREQNENARQELKAQLDSMKATLQGWLDDPEQFRGPKGEQGPKGEKGDKGDKGEQGPPGQDGKSLEFHWNGTKLGIRVEGETTYQYVDLKGDQGGTGDGVIPVASSTILGGIKVGENLKIDENGVLSVDTATDVEQDNTKPVTSAAVHVQLGNVEALLSAL